MKNLYKRKRFKIQIALLTSFFITIVYLIAGAYFFKDRIDSSLTNALSSMVNKIDLLENGMNSEYKIGYSKNHTETFLYGLANYGEEILIIGDRYNDVSIRKDHSDETPLDSNKIFESYAKRHISTVNAKDLLSNPTINLTKNIDDYSVDSYIKNGRFFVEISRDVDTPVNHPLHDSRVKIKRDVTRFITNSIDATKDMYLPLLIGCIAFGILASTLSVKIAFKPLAKMIIDEFEKVKESNFTKKMSGSNKYDKEMVKVIDSINLVISDMEKLINSNKETVEFITHEIKNHLSIIKTTVDIVDRYKILDKERIAAANKVVNDQVQRALSTVESIRSLTELNSDTTKKEMAYYDINELIDTIVLQAKEDFLNITFALDIKCYSDKIRINKNHFILALAPILTNAAEYSLDGSDVVNIEVSDDLDNLYISVSNYGSEIPEEELPYIFMQYFRGSTTKKTVKGSGIGLSITKRIIDIYNGTIRAESENKKTTFHISLPLDGE